MTALITAHAQFVADKWWAASSALIEAMIEQIHVGNAAICTESVWLVYKIFVLIPTRLKTAKFKKKFKMTPSKAFYLWPVHNLGVFGNFWARKRAKISPKMASVTYYWASKWTRICPKWPQIDYQMTPTVLSSCGWYYCMLYVYYCMLFGAFHVIFGFWATKGPLLNL